MLILSLIVTSIDTDVGKLKEVDIKDIIKQLGPNDITALFQSLGLGQTFIDRKSKVIRSNVEQQAKQVLHRWRQIKQPTIGDLLKALEKAQNKNAAEILQEKWGIVDYKGN